MRQILVVAEDYADRAWGIAEIDDKTELVLEMNGGYSDLYYRNAKTKRMTTDYIFFEEPSHKNINEYCSKMHDLIFVNDYNY